MTLGAETAVIWLLDAGKQLYREGLKSIFRNMGLVASNSGEKKLAEYLELLQRDLHRVEKKIDEQTLSQLYGGFSQLHDSTRTKAKHDSVTHALDRFHSVASISNQGRTGRFRNIQLRSLAYFGMAAAHKLLDDSDELVADKIILAVDADPFTAFDFIGVNETQRVLVQLERQLPSPGFLIADVELIREVGATGKGIWKRKPKPSVSFSADGKFFACTADKNVIEIWDGNSFEVLGTCKGDNESKEPIVKVALHPSKKILAIGWERDFGNRWKEIQILDIETCEVTHSMQLEDEKRWVNELDLSFNLDGTLLAAASGGEAYVWDVATGKQIAKLESVFEHGLNRVAFHPTKRFLAAVPNTCTGLVVFNLDTGDDVFLIHRCQYGVALSSKGDLIASWHCDEGAVCIWHIEDGLKEAAKTNIWPSLDSHDAKVRLRNSFAPIAFDVDGSVLATARGNDIALWDPYTEKCIRTLEGHSDSVHSLSFHPNGRHLASASIDGTVRIWGIRW